MLLLVVPAVKVTCMARVDLFVVLGALLSELKLVVVKGLGIASLVGLVVVIVLGLAAVAV